MSMRVGPALRESSGRASSDARTVVTAIVRDEIIWKGMHAELFSSKDKGGDKQVLSLSTLHNLPCTHSITLIAGFAAISPLLRWHRAASMVKQTRMEAAYELVSESLSRRGLIRITLSQKSRTLT